MPVPQNPDPPWPTSSALLSRTGSSSSTSSSQQLLGSQLASSGQDQSIDPLFDFESLLPSSNCSTVSPSPSLACPGYSTQHSDSPESQVLFDFNSFDWDSLSHDPPLVIADNPSQTTTPLVKDSVSFDLDPIFQQLGEMSDTLLLPPSTAGLEDSSWVQQSAKAFTTTTVASPSTNTLDKPSAAVPPPLHRHEYPPIAAKPSSVTLPTSSGPSSSVPAAASTNTKKRTRLESNSAPSSNDSALDSEEERILERRRRNTLAARRFRQRKQDRVLDLERRLAEVTKERDELRLQVAKWEGEVMALRKLVEMRD